MPHSSVVPGPSTASTSQSEKPSGWKRELWTTPDALHEGAWYPSSCGAPASITSIPAIASPLQRGRDSMVRVGRTVELLPWPALAFDAPTRVRKPYDAGGRAA